MANKRKVFLALSIYDAMTEKYCEKDLSNIIEELECNLTEDEFELFTEAVSEKTYRKY